MNKVFNKKRIKEFIDNNSLNEVIESHDFITKNVFKKINKFKEENYAFVLFNWMKKHNKNIPFMVEKFFPTKISEIKQNGDFEITKFWYSPTEDKIHCLVKQEGNERHLKIHTDRYRERTEEFTKEMIADLKKQADKLYGYFIVVDSLGWYVTDMNISKKGTVKRMVSKIDNVIINNNIRTFGNINNLDELLICC